MQVNLRTCMGAASMPGAVAEGTVPCTGASSSCVAPHATGAGAQHSSSCPRCDERQAAGEAHAAVPPLPYGEVAKGSWDPLNIFTLACPNHIAATRNAWCAHHHKLPPGAAGHLPVCLCAHANVQAKHAAVYSLLLHGSSRLSQRPWSAGSCHPLTTQVSTVQFRRHGSLDQACAAQVHGRL
jgi:hypothetical protein